MCVPAHQPMCASLVSVCGPALTTWVTVDWHAMHACCAQRAHLTAVACALCCCSGAKSDVHTLKTHKRIFTNKRGALTQAIPQAGYARQFLTQSKYRKRAGEPFVPCALPYHKEKESGAGSLRPSFTAHVVAIPVPTLFHPRAPQAAFAAPAAVPFCAQGRGMRQTEPVTSYLL